MQKKYFYFNTIILLGFLCINFSNLSSQCDERYFFEIFDPPSTPVTVDFGQNITEDGKDQTLKMDIYMPKDDQSTCRPAIFMAFGGSFVAGSRDLPDIKFLCEEFTKLGYVAIAIDYRLESTITNLTSSENMVKALIRGVHDGKAAVRYLRKNAIDGENDYGVDPDQIFFGGVSAGALLAIHLAYMDLDDPLEQTWLDYIDELGGLEGNSGTPGYSSEISGVINIAGAIGGTEYISAGDVPIVNFHSDGDGTVPYMTGYPLGLNTLPQIYGSFHIQNRMDELGITSSLYEYNDNNHPPYFLSNNTYDQDVIKEIAVATEAFLYGLVECIDCIPEDTMSSIRNVIQLENVNIFPNPTVGLLNIQVDNMSNDAIEWTLVDQAGKLIDTGIENSNEFTLNSNEYSKGFYFLKLEMEDRVFVEKVCFD